MRRNSRRDRSDDVEGHRDQYSKGNYEISQRQSRQEPRPRFFIVTTLDWLFVDMAISRGIWVLPRYNQAAQVRAMFNSAFASGADIFVFPLVIGTEHFQGCMRMTAAVNARGLPLGSSDIFGVRFECLREVHFRNVEHLRNYLLDDRPSIVHADNGDELPVDVGHELLRLLRSKGMPLTQELVKQRLRGPPELPRRPAAEPYDHRRPQQRSPPRGRSSPHRGRSVSPAGRYSHRSYSPEPHTTGERRRHSPAQRGSRASAFGTVGSQRDQQQASSSRGYVGRDAAAGAAQQLGSRRSNGSQAYRAGDSPPRIGRGAGYDDDRSEGSSDRCSYDHHSSGSGRRRISSGWRELEARRRGLSPVGSGGADGRRRDELGTDRERVPTRSGQPSQQQPRQPTDAVPDGEPPRGVSSTRRPSERVQAYSIRPRDVGPPPGYSPAIMPVARHQAVESEALGNYRRPPASPRASASSSRGPADAEEQQEHHAPGLSSPAAASSRPAAISTAAVPAARSPAAPPSSPASVVAAAAAAADAASSEAGAEGAFAASTAVRDKVEQSLSEWTGARRRERVAELDAALERTNRLPLPVLQQEQQAQEEGKEHMEEGKQEQAPSKQQGQASAGLAGPPGYTKAAMQAIEHQKEQQAVQQQEGQEGQQGQQQQGQEQEQRAVTAAAAPAGEVEASDTSGGDAAPLPAAQPDDSTGSGSATAGDPPANISPYAALCPEELQPHNGQWTEPQRLSAVDAAEADGRYEIGPDGLPPLPPGACEYALLSGGGVKPTSTVNLSYDGFTRLGFSASTLADAPWYFYLDPHGTIQGPATALSMAAWVHARYLLSSTWVHMYPSHLGRPPAAWKPKRRDFVMLDVLARQAMAAQAKGRVRAAEAAAGRTAGGEQHAPNKERLAAAPSLLTSQQQLAAEAAQGAVQARQGKGRHTVQENDAQVDEGLCAVPGLPAEGALRALLFQQAPDSTAGGDRDGPAQWLYKDPTGAVHGPFSASDMLCWVLSKELPLTAPAHALWPAADGIHREPDADAFRPLSVLLEHLRAPANGPGSTQQSQGHQEVQQAERQQQQRQQEEEEEEQAPGLHTATQPPQSQQLHGLSHGTHIEQQAEQAGFHDAGCEGQGSRTVHQRMGQRQHQEPDPDSPPSRMSVLTLQQLLHRVMPQRPEQQAAAEPLGADEQLDAAEGNGAHDGSRSPKQEQEAHSVTPPPPAVAVPQPSLHSGERQQQQQEKEDRQSVVEAEEEEEEEQESKVDVVRAVQQSASPTAAGTTAAPLGVQRASGGAAAMVPQVPSAQDAGSALPAVISSEAAEGAEGMDAAGMALLAATGAAAAAAGPAAATSVEGAAGDDGAAGAGDDAAGVGDAAVQRDGDGEDSHQVAVHVSDEGQLHLRVEAM